MTSTDPKPTHHVKLIGVFVLGILIPLLAAAMPWLMERVFPQNSITYTFQGPISGDKFVALELKIENNGRKVEQDIEAYIPANIFKSAEIEKDKSGLVKMIEKSPNVIMESNAPSAKMVFDEKNIVVKIDSIKPEEKVSIKIFIYGGSALVFESELRRARITSQDILAKYASPSDIEIYIYKVGTWLLILYFVVTLAYSFYYEKIMSREEKEKRLLQQIDRLM